MIICAICVLLCKLLFRDATSNYGLILVMFMKMKATVVQVMYIKIQEEEPCLSPGSPLSRTLILLYGIGELAGRSVIIRIMCKSGRNPS